LPLPEQLGGDDEPKWEGLAMTPEGGIWLAVDRRTSDRPNLARITAPPSKAP
jgi:hypothetical protein